MKFQLLFIFGFTILLFGYRNDKKLFLQFTSTSGFDCYENIYLYTDTSYKYSRGSVTYGSWPIDSGKYMLTDTILILNSYKNDTVKQFGERSACRQSVSKVMRVKRQSVKPTGFSSFISTRKVKRNYLLLTN